MQSKTKVFILSLGRRGGSVRYGTSIIDALSCNKEVFVSSFCIETTPTKSKKIPTYRNKFEFLISSFTILPLLWIYVLFGLITKRYIAFYSPYTHYWNIVFIITFKIFNVKTNLTVHDGIPHTGDGNIWERIINYVTLKNSHRLIFLTNYVKLYLKSKINFSAESVVIPHGPLVVNGYHGVKQKPIKAFRILFLGRVCHYKGVDLLIQALQLLPDAIVEKCIIAGEVTNDQKFLIAQTYNNKKIEWLDKWLSHQEILTCLEETDLIVLPYREATQSGVMSIGIQTCIPMLSTNVGGLSEQCTSEEVHFVAPKPESIAEGLKYIKDSDSFYETSIKNLEQKNTTLNWESIAFQIDNLLKN